MKWYCPPATGRIRYTAFFVLGLLIALPECLPEPVFRFFYPLVARIELRPARPDDRDAIDDGYDSLADRLTASLHSKGA